MKPYTHDEAEADLIEALHEGDAETITALASLVERLEPARAPLSLPLAALWYAEQHIALFPCAAMAKAPLVTHGVKDATTDVQQVARWWTRWPTANIGLATGVKFDVIDFDGAAAHAAWGESFPRPSRWRPTLADDGYAGFDFVGSVSTPRPGGLHIYVKPTGMKNRAGVGEHVDYRGRGGYVVAPPSETDDRPGQVAGTYRWLRRLALR